MSPAQLGATGQSTVAQLRHMGGAGAAYPLHLAGANAARSWMAPDAKKSKSLLYVADQGANDVEVYSYPGGKLKGTLTGFQTPSGVCSNKAGDVFILNGNGTSVEVYAHGGSSPIRTLGLPGYPELNCSVDPTTPNTPIRRNPDRPAVQLSFKSPPQPLPVGAGFRLDQTVGAHRS